MIKVLLSHGMEFVLTERFNQDSVEIFFGQQRSRGGRSDNPSVTQFMHNAQALMVQKSLALGGSSNISQKRSYPVNTSPLSRPMTKCKRRRIVK